MADFATDYTPVKRIILPSSKPNDQRWIDIYTEPSAGSKLAGMKTNMSKVFATTRKAKKLDPDIKPEDIDYPEDAFAITPDFEYQQAVPLIKAWNFKDGAEDAPITSENLQRLREDDWEALKKEIELVKQDSTIDESKKK